MGMLQKLYGRFYTMYPLFVKPSDLGHSGTARARVYVIMAHRYRLRQTFDCKTLYDLITSAMKSVASTKPSDYFIASKVDIRLDAERTAIVRKKVLKPKDTRLKIKKGKRTGVLTRAYLMTPTVESQRRLSCTTSSTLAKQKQCLS